jgi:hypothetical protein
VLSAVYNDDTASEEGPPEMPYTPVAGYHQQHMYSYCERLQQAVPHLATELPLHQRKVPLRLS